MSESSPVIRADVRMKFYTRFLILGVAGLGVAGWFFYDGYYNWPRLNEVWAAYEELKPDDHDGSVSHQHEEPADKPLEHGDDFPQDEWESMVAERGWESSVVYSAGEARQPKGRVHGDLEIQAQFFFSVVCLLAGVAFLTKVLRARGSWIESDGDSVTSSWGKGFRFDDVTEINKKKWQGKGLAYVKHAADGATRTFVIDDLKFDRHATDAILYQVEQAVGVDKIVGGRPEEDPNAEPIEEEAPVGEPA
ncbi:MAG: hypothetical protein AAGG46_06105 [Planctomycetota bacterium]